MLSHPENSNPMTSTQIEWDDFLITRMKYWERFYDKWIVDRPQHTVLIDYDDLIRSPFDQIAKVVRFFGENPVNEARLHEVIESQNVRDRGSLSDFKYFDPIELNKVEQRAGEKMERMEIARISS